MPINKFNELKFVQVITKNLHWYLGKRLVSRQAVEIKMHHPDQIMFFDFHPIVIEETMVSQNNFLMVVAI